MKILVHYNFTDEQMQAFADLAAGHGDHLVVGAASAEEAVQKAADIEVILGSFSPEVCAAAPELRWIQSFSAGMDYFLFSEVVESDVVVTNMAGVYAPQGGEHAWALLLALTRGVPDAVRSKDRREWKSTAPPIEITGNTLGIIGLGGFGVETAKRALGYDMTVIALDPVCVDAPPGVTEVRSPSPENLHWLLERSEAVVIACPKTPQTYHLIGDAEFAAMKETAYLISVSRGGIIDEPALARALQAGDIAGAGLDVCEVEPLPSESPLWEAPNLVITPHRAGASQHRPRKVFEFFYANLERYLRQEPLVNVVDKSLGYGTTPYVSTPAP